MLMLRNLVLVLLLLAGSFMSALADDYEDLRAITPPRLSYVDGDISFWRPGAEDWLAARLNTPVAVGDELYAGDGANFELQIGARAFLRGDEETQIALVNQEPDFLQFKVTTGRVSLDLRQLDPGMSIELSTPNAVFTISREGYYRLDVNYDTLFTTRRGGRATVIPAGGRPLTILPSEETVVRGGGVARVETYVAPEPDRWDRWNFARTDDLLDAVSTRYLPPGVYGAHELDRYGTWRLVPEYGHVWIPDGIPRGWAPYSTGNWVWDPYYEWTWIDDAPWGWAPFHYGRWVWIDGLWAWAPGPVVVRRPVYSPALVSFFWAGDDISIRIGIGTPGVFWVALGWGEPCVPWWGKPHFRGKPWWGGWHGPRIVNNVVVKETTIINVTNIVYRNTKVDKAVLYLPRDKFGHGHERARYAERVNVREMSRVQGALPIKPGPQSVAIDSRRGVRPPKDVSTRSTVVTRPPKETRLPWRSEPASAKQPPPPSVRVVPPPKREESRLRRPDYGTQGFEERIRPSQPPRLREMPQVMPAPQERQAAPRGEPMPPLRMERQVQPGREAAPVQAGPQARETPQYRETREIRREREEQVAPRQETRTQERVQEQERPLPGKPANRVYRKGESDDRDKDRGRGQR